MRQTNLHEEMIVGELNYRNWLTSIIAPTGYDSLTGHDTVWTINYDTHIVVPDILLYVLYHFRRVRNQRLRIRFLGLLTNISLEKSYRRGVAKLGKSKILFGVIIENNLIADNI